MLRKILRYGVIGGLIVGAVLFTLTVSTAGQPPLEYGMVVGYLTMLVALSTIFVGIKRYRDQDLGGVIRFWPAFAMGLAISFIASVFYVIAWEASIAVTGVNFGETYATFLIEQEKAKGLNGAALDRFIQELEVFKIQYANPLFRIPMTFTEILPVGVLVSLISAALLRNSRFMALKRAVL